MPYKFVVSVDSKGFNEAPDEILRCLGRLTWATEQAVVTAGDPFIPPNELLVLGYFEGMKIGVCCSKKDEPGLVADSSPSIMMTVKILSALQLPHSLLVRNAQ